MDDQGRTKACNKYFVLFMVVGRMRKRMEAERCRSEIFCFCDVADTLTLHGSRMHNGRGLLASRFELNTKFKTSETDDEPNDSCWQFQSYSILTMTRRRRASCNGIQQLSVVATHEARTGFALQSLWITNKRTTAVNNVDRSSISSNSDSQQQQALDDIVTMQLL
jgi:hypothetical protein